MRFNLSLPLFGVILGVLLNIGTASAQDDRHLFGYNWETTSVRPSGVLLSKAGRSPASVSGPAASSTAASTRAMTVQNGIFNYPHRESPREIHDQVERELETQR